MASTERPAARKRGDDDAQMIRKATTTILAQASSVNLDCWEFLVRSLRSPEPAIRHMALIGVDHSLGPVPADSSTSQPTRREIVSVLGDILANDVDERNRSLAAVVLGRVCGSFGLSMPSTARDGFAWCLKHFMLLQQDAPRPGLGPARCCALHAIGKLVEDNVDVQDGDFDKLADQLLQVLVGGPDDAEGDVQRAHAISLLARLPATNRNRQRVMRFWPCLRSLIRRLMYAPGGGADAILTTAISKFASQWYQRVPDAILDRFPLYDQLSGYAELQYSVLLNAEAEGTANPRNRLRAEIGPAEYLGIADRDHVMQFLKRYSRRVQIADLLPEKFDLTFQAEALNNEMFFDTLHPTRVLHLTNRSAKTAHLFTVQVAPTRFFSVSPAFGEIAPHTSLPITITFTRAYPAEKGTGRGYIRLRSWTGFAFERLSLRFYNGPFVQIVNTTVDFGPCPPGRRFLRKVFVKNIGINDIVCAVDLIQVAAGMTDDPVSTFELSPRSGVIAPNSTMGFDVVFTAAPGAPRADATLSFSGVGQSDANEVVLSGSTGFPLKFDEDLIDMGPCQLLERVSTAVNVTNLAPFPLFVQFDGTVDNLVIESVTIPALQTRTISVAWEANVVGDVNELVYVRVPHCAPTTIAFAAFVGPILTTPMAPRLQMPFVSVHFVLQSVIPVHNRSRYDAEFVVDGLDGTPFLVTVVDPLRHAKDVAAFDGDMAGKQAPQRFKDMLAQTRNKVHSVKARSTVYLHVLFTSHKPGFFEREFVVGVVAPRPTKWRPFMLRAAAVLDNEKFPLKKLLLFLGEDGVFKAADLTRLPSKDFEGAIESRMIFGDTWSGISHRNETFAFGSREEWGWAQRPLPPVVVENLSSRPHNFSMMVTWPFVGTNARHGICGAFDKMLIPNDISPEYHHADETTPVDGFVVVRDNFSKTSICHIHHVPTHIVVVDAARHHRSRIVFPVVEVGVVSIVPIVVENRSGLTVAFRIVIDDGGVDTGFSSDDQLAHPLQAWEMRSVPIRFQSSIKGQYVSRLQVVYEDPSTPTNTFVAFECELVGVAGHADLEVSTAVVDFGNCGVGALAEGDLAVANHDDVDLPLNVVVSEPFALASTADTVDVDQVVILPAGRSAPVRLQFRPMASGRFWTRMQFVKGDAAHDVVLFGEGGVMSLTSSMGPPVQVIEQQQQRIPGNENGAKVDSSSSSSSNGTGEIDMGTVRVCTVATRPLRLINNGTIDIVLSNIVAIADEGLSYAFMDGDIVATGAGDLPQFGRELPDALAIDWDEVAYQRAHAAAQQQQQQQRQGDPGKTTTATTATASMESAFPKVLQPGGSLTLQLSFSRYLTGIFHPWLRIMTVERGGEPRERFSFALKFNVQDVMDISESALEFGVVPIGHIARLTMSFYNECTQAVPWRVVVTDLVATQTVGDRQRAPVRNDTFACEPASGVLAGGHEQVVTVSFVTIVPHLSMTASATLHTSDIGVTKIGVSAMSGAPMIVASEPDIRFGCIGLGSTKSKVLMLVNEGELPAAFLLRTPSKLFHIVPTRGTIAPKSRQPLWIKFAPVDSEAISVQLRVDWGDHFDRLKSRLMIPMSGQGGSSQVVVKVSTVDFGMTMLGTDAVQTLRVFNTGTAEALVEIDLPDPSLRADCDNVFFVEPHQHRDLQLIFHPTTPVAINAPASLFSKDSTQDRITIQIKGRVGVPCIELGPPGAVDSNTLNMGICMVRKPTQRSFYVDNTGNMDVPFEVVVLRQQAQTGAEQTRAPQDAQAGNAAMFAVESKFPRLAPRDPQWALLADKLVPAHAGDTFFKIEPMSGVFATGSRVTFAVEFLPPASEIVLDVLVLVRNPFAPFGLVATAISDEPTIEIDIPERVLDFGLCRCHNTFKRRFRVLNKGNVAYSYHLGPDVRDPQWATFRDDYEAARLIWAAQMKALGFTTSYNGTCPRKGYSDVTIAFTPTKAGEVSASVRVVCSGGYEQLDVRGVGGISALDLTRPVGVDGGVAGSVAANFCDFGLRPIGRPQQMTLLLRNRGTLPSGFLVRRTMPDAFVVQPLSGRIGAGAEVPLSVTFRPRAHGLSQFDLLVRGIDNTVAPCRIVGRGGDGVLGVRYLHDRDADLRGIEFGLVNVGVVVEKSLLLYNEGQVELRLWAECDDRAFAIRLQRDPQPFKAMVDLDCLPRQQGYHRVVSRVMTPDTKFADAMLFAQMRTLETTIPPGQFVVAAIALAAHEPRRYAGILTLACEFNRMGVPLRAEGGTVHIAHQGDLNFGSVGVDHVYERTVTLVNTGSISTQARLSWSIPGAAHRAAAIVALGDPNGTPARRLWQRSIRFVVRLLRVAKIASRFGTLEQMLEAITADRKNRAMRIKQVANANQQRSLQEQLDAVTTTALEQRQSAKDVQAALPQNHPAFDAAVSLREAGNLVSLRMALLQDRIEKRIATSDVAQESPLTTLMDYAGSNVTSLRTAAFGSLRREADLTTGGPAGQRGQLAVSPARVTLDVDVPVTLSIRASFPPSDAFVGALLVTPDLLGCDEYALSVAARPMSAKMTIDNAGPLSFGRISLGTMETVTRTLTNNGLLPIKFAVRHRNFGLTVTPGEGLVEAEDTCVVTFQFRPVDEEWQRSPITIETDSTDAIVIPFDGAGGVPKLHIASFERFDFGRCMAGRVAKRSIRLFNTGNAQLPVVRCMLDQTMVFSKGASWPVTRFMIDPGAYFDLNVEFMPQSEDVFRGRVVIETDTRIVPIELMGTGREALLSFQAQNVDLANTIVGNVYRREMIITNISDLEYPLQLSIVEPGGLTTPLTGDFKLEATDLVLAPFEQRHISFSYKASRECDTQVLMHMSSIFSENDVPIPVMTGTAIVSVDTDEVDFGQFQQGYTCSRTITIRNTGTIAVAFRIHSSRDQDVLGFSLSRWRGLLVPNRDVEITIKTTLTTLTSFDDELCLETQVEGQRHFIRVRGQCDTPVIDKAKFQRVDFGDCLVGEAATETFVIENTGGFPLTYRMKATFPVRIAPTNGSIAGNSRQRFTVTWVPSGGYSLRSTIKAHTNLGIVDINLKGRGAYPRFTISNAYLDFGVGAINHVYEQRFKVINRSRVGIRWTNPAVEEGFHVAPRKGSLAEGESVIVRVRFEPKEFKRYTGTVVIESKGRYREVQLNGIGGVLRLDTAPELDIGDCPAGYWRQAQLPLANVGDVPLSIRASPQGLDPGFTVLVAPESLAIAPLNKDSLRVRVRADESYAGRFHFTISLMAPERTWKVTVRGTAVSLRAAFSSLTSTLLRADGNLMRGAPRWQQWPNALALPDELSVNDGAAGGRNREDVRSVVELLVTAVEEMVRQGDRTTQQSFGELLTAHIDEGRASFEASYQDRDRIAGIVTAYAPLITDADIRKVTALKEPSVDNELDSTLTASPPIFLPELTCI